MDTYFALSEDSAIDLGMAKILESLEGLAHFHPMLGGAHPRIFQPNLAESDKANPDLNRVPKLAFYFPIGPESFQRLHRVGICSPTANSILTCLLGLLILPGNKIDSRFGCLNLESKPNMIHSSGAFGRLLE